VVATQSTGAISCARSASAGVRPGRRNALAQGANWAMTMYVLTTGTDNVTGGSGFTPITGKSTEWQAADQIDGGGGADQLQIAVASAASAVVTDYLFQNVKASKAWP
jgi:hypothetical protein